ncbi:MAG: hypothetical protein LH650_03250 [Chloroflexi bacterium]|nr:hypothetical protein [Chloroflexota bacterium]
MTIPDAPPLFDGVLPRTRRRLVDTAMEVGTTVVLAVLLYLVIQTILVGTYRVEQVSTGWPGRLAVADLSGRAGRPDIGAVTRL